MSEYFFISRTCAECGRKPDGIIVYGRGKNREHKSVCALHAVKAIFEGDEKTAKKKIKKKNIRKCFVTNVA